MKNNYLFPTCFQKIGWILLVPSLILSGCALFYLFSWDAGRVSMKVFALLTSTWGDEFLWFTGIENEVVDELAMVMLIVSLVFIGFSRERDEDECIAKIRSNALIRASLIAYGLIVFTTLFLFEMAYFYAMIVNMLLVLILFVIKFRYELYQFRKSGRDEE